MSVEEVMWDGWWWVNRGRHMCCMRTDEHGHIVEAVRMSFC
jgi:hypothetical protein